MPSLLSLSAQEQSQILRAGAAQLNKAANILEKDVWVCWALKQVFSIPHKHKMCFKGGTSLSKA
jgi:predicted nucleotidyltransferase component of viral defense system